MTPEDMKDERLRQLRVRAEAEYTINQLDATKRELAYLAYRADPRNDGCLLVVVASLLWAFVVVGVAIYAGCTAT